MTTEQHRSKTGQSEIYDFTEKLIAAGFILTSLTLSGLAALICAPVNALRRIVR